MIHSHCHLNAQIIQLSFIHNQPSVIDQNVDYSELFLHILRKLFDGCSFREVKFEPFHCTFRLRKRVNNGFGGFIVLLFASASKNNIVSITVEASRSLKPDSGVSTCNNYIFS